ncbi:hypothetical protein [Vibrio harveyi]|uniref:hypothetical protein n=1 Tax=Vibrio harveyi TaxID=669 RepID=UPI003CF8A6F7
MNQNIVRNELLDACCQVFIEGLPTVLDQYGASLKEAVDIEYANNLGSYVSMHEVAFEESCGFWIESLRSHSLLSENSHELIPCLPEELLNLTHKENRHSYDSLTSHIKEVVTDTLIDLLGYTVCHQILFDIVKRIKANGSIEPANAYNQIIRDAVNSNLKGNADER